MQHSVDLENRVLDDGIIENRVVIVPRCTFFFCCRFKTFFNLFLSLQPHQFVKFTISWLVVETFRLQIGQITVSKLHCEFRRSIIELITCKTCSKKTNLVFWKYKIFTRKIYLLVLIKYISGNSSGNTHITVITEQK